MKKLLLLIGIFFGACSNNHNQEIFVPEHYRNIYDMEQRFRIYRAWSRADPMISYDRLGYIDSLKYGVFISPNLLIRDLFTFEEVDNVYDRTDPVDRNKFAMYTINYFGCPLTYDLLLYNKGEFTVINVGPDYPRILKEIIRYFDKHKDVDERLLALCVQEATKIYVHNRFRDSYGPWREWIGEEADSLGRIYNQYLRYR